MNTTDLVNMGDWPMSRVFTNGPGDRGSIPGRVIPKTQKMVVEATLLSTQDYKVQIKSKMEQSKERSSALPLHLGVVAIEKGSLRVTPDCGRQLYFYFKIMLMITTVLKCFHTFWRLITFCWHYQMSNKFWRQWKMK